MWGLIFSRGHAILHLAVSVGRSVRRSVGHNVKKRAVIALLLLPNRLRLSCRVSGLDFSRVLRDSTPRFVGRSVTLYFFYSFYSY